MERGHSAAVNLQGGRIRAARIANGGTTMPDDKTSPKSRDNDSKSSGGPGNGSKDKNAKTSTGSGSGSKGASGKSSGGKSDSHRSKSR